MRNEARCIEDRAVAPAPSFFCKVVDLLHVVIFYIIQKHVKVKIIPTIKFSVLQDYNSDPLLRPSGTPWCSTCTPGHMT